MVKIKFEILGKSWDLCVLKRKKYNKKNGNDSVAITYGWKRRIDVGADVDLETIIHEVAHAYATEMCITSATEMSASDMEEFFCELIAKRGRELLNLCDDLYVQVTAAMGAKITSVYKKEV